MLALAVALAGCGPAKQPETAVPKERVPCAIGDAALVSDCSIERVAVAEGTQLTIRHPDGGFRRLIATSAVEYRAADGAEPAQVIRRDDGSVDVRIANARYRLPAPGQPSARP